MSPPGAAVEPLASAWLRRLSRWLPPPEGTDWAARRFYSAAPMLPLLLMTQVGYGVLFAWWGVGPLVAVSAVTAMAWVVVMGLARRESLVAAGTLACLTHTVFASAVVVLVGWGLGAQYVVLVVLVVAVLTPWPRPMAFLVCLAVALLFLAGYYYAEAVSPRYDLPAVGQVVVQVLLVALGFLSLAYAVNDTLTRLERAESELAAEHARSERLLTNVLPVPIAERLKEHEEVIADGVDGASVLFADIVGFTTLSAQRTPDEIVAMLNGVFTRLDALVDAHGLEKIKTIGDAYMVASGIPTPRGDHAQVLARFALAARDELAAHNFAADVPVQLRIGINSGPVVAGVIGRRRLLYDLWGDTVNTASRMESHGIPGQIQITEATRALLGGEFACTERGVIDIKGKGPTRTWLLESEAIPSHAR